VASLLGSLGANILEVSHGRLFLDVPAKGVSIDITIETRDRKHTLEVFEALAAEGLAPQRINSRCLSETAY
jgi:threonine dehydratase